MNEKAAIDGRLKVGTFIFGRLDKKFLASLSAFSTKIPIMNGSLSFIDQ